MISNIKKFCFLIGPNCEAVFESTSLYALNSTVYPQLAIVFDFNNDNKLDIAFTYTTVSDISVFLGNNNGTFQSIITSSINNFNAFQNLIAGDVNNDNKLDVIFADAISSYLGIVLGNGDGTFEVQPVFLISVYTFSYQMVLAHFDNNQYLDIALVDTAVGNIYLYAGYGNGNFLLNLTLSVGFNNYPYSITTADFDNDGYLDIAVSNYNARNISLFLGNGHGHFQEPKQSFTGGGLQPLYLSFGNFNGDNLIDIVITYDSSDFAVVFGLGNGTFGDKKHFHLNQTYASVITSVGDFNNDGHLDIVIGEYSPIIISILYGDGYGHFWFGTMFSTEIYGYQTWINVGDFNNDGYQDILATESLSGVMYLFLNMNNCNSTTSIQTTAVYP